MAVQSIEILDSISSLCKVLLHSKDFLKFFVAHEHDKPNINLLDTSFFCIKWQSNYLEKDAMKEKINQRRHHMNVRIVNSLDLD